MIEANVVRHHEQRSDLTNTVLLPNTVRVKYAVREMTDHLDLPAPPWRERARAARSARPPRPAREPLTRDAIVDAAIRVIQREGFDGLSMRRLAQELDTAPSSLYAHVSGKEELLDLLIDRVSAEIKVPERPDPQRWREQLKQIARDTHRALTAHADVARAALAHIPVGPQALRVSNAAMEIMLAGGLPPQYAAWALDRIFLYITADAYEGSLLAAKTRAMGQTVEEFFGEFATRMREYYQALPPDRFPALVANVDALLSGGGDERFEFGLSMLVDGLQRYVDEAP
jgi:AcrR family transcriptional regulator